MDIGPSRKVFAKLTKSVQNPKHKRDLLDVAFNDSPQSVTNGIRAKHNANNRNQAFSVPSSWRMTVYRFQSYPCQLFQ